MIVRNSDETNPQSSPKRYEKPILTKGPVLSAVTAAKTVSGTVLK